MHDDPRARIPDGWTEGHLDLPGVRLHYLRSGAPGREGAARPVRPRSLVLLHGAMDSGLCWLRVARALSADFDVVMPDARFHGQTRTAEPELTMSAMADDVAGLIRELGLAPAALVGHSMGGQVATEVAARHPGLVDRVVVEDPAYFIAERPGLLTLVFVATMRASWAWMRTRTPEQIDHLAQRMFRAWSPEDRSTWALAQYQSTRGSFRVLRGAFDRARAWDPILRSVQAPTLLVTAEKGLTTPAQAARVLAALPHARVVRVPGAGHNVRRDNYPAFMAAVRPFLVAG